MSLAAAGIMRREACTALICIDSFDDYSMTGRLYHSSLAHEAYFRSFMELIEILEHIFNMLEYPQSSMTLRSFEGTKPAERYDIRKPAIPASVPFNAKGSTATFRLRVMFRQNATWQGSVRWMEADKEENFRSVLELLHLMDSAIPNHTRKAELPYFENVM